METNLKGLTISITLRDGAQEKLCDDILDAVFTVKEVVAAEIIDRRYDGLKDCPFCGERPKVGSLGGDRQNWSIYCQKCGIPCCENNVDETLEDIKKQWNTRVEKK